MRWPRKWTRSAIPSSAASASSEPARGPSPASTKSTSGQLGRGTQQDRVSLLLVEPGRGQHERPRRAPPISFAQPDRRGAVEAVDLDGVVDDLDLRSAATEALGQLAGDRRARRRCSGRRRQRGRAAAGRRTARARTRGSAAPSRHRRTAGERRRRRVPTWRPAASSGGRGRSPAARPQQARQAEARRAPAKPSGIGATRRTGTPMPRPARPAAGTRGPRRAAASAASARDRGSRSASTARARRRRARGYRCRRRSIGPRRSSAASCSQLALVVDSRSSASTPAQKA